MYINSYTTLYHYGVKGQKWGVRRYQNYDGTYTPKGRIHYQKLRKATYDALTFNDKWMRGFHFVSAFDLLNISTKNTKLGLSFIQSALRRKI